MLRWILATVVSVYSVKPTSVDVLKYCRKCSQEKGICRRCGNPPIFIREEAIRAVQNYHLGATGNPYGLSEEMVSLKVKQYEQLIRDIEEGKLNDNKSIWKVINDILQ